VALAVVYSEGYYPMTLRHPPSRPPVSSQKTTQPSDIAATEAFWPRDPVDRGVGVFAGPAEIGAEGGDAEHAASSACSFFLLRPPGLPDCPFRKPVCNGGRAGPAL
jgi:hypothetical protein